MKNEKEKLNLDFVSQNEKNTKLRNEEKNLEKEKNNLKKKATELDTQIAKNKKTMA